MPTTETEWYSIAKDYEALWNFPHCLGAVDGRHCILQAPTNSGSDFFNYKPNFSTVLMELQMQTIVFYLPMSVVKVGYQMEEYSKTRLFGKKLENKELNLLSDGILPGRKMKVLYVFLGDDAFSLHEHLMKPYSVEQKKGSKKRIFNYRVCRARRVTENVFDIMSAVFRVLKKIMLLSPEKATLVILSCVYLHNFLRKSKNSQNTYTPFGTFDQDKNGIIHPGHWRNELEENVKSFLPLKKVEAIRN